jgi:hypothetical protein
MINENNALAAFDGINIRKTWNNKEWWFVIEDVVFALTDSSDPKQYIQKMKQRDEILAKGWVQIVHTLSVETSGGKVAGNARKDAEKEIGKSILSNENYLETPEKLKRISQNNSNSE